MTKNIKFDNFKETDFEKISFEEVSINKLDKCDSMLGNELCYFINRRNKNLDGRIKIYSERNFLHGWHDKKEKFGK